jgi:hypothetical protein
MSVITDALKRAEDKRVTAYLETLLWSECFHGQGDDGEDPLVIDGEEYEAGTPIDQIPGCDVSDLATLAPGIVTEAREDLAGFASYVEETLGFDPFLVFDPAQVAHDFCLSRNGHGAGFFDGDYVTVATDEIRELLSKSTWEGMGVVTKEGEEMTVNVNDALQDAAKTFGTMGLSVWTDENGMLCMESHS